jgi:hypothetical protein
LSSHVDPAHNGRHTQEGAPLRTIAFVPDPPGPLATASATKRSSGSGCSTGAASFPYRPAAVVRPAAAGRLLCRSRSRRARRPLSPLADLKRRRPRSAARAAKRPSRATRNWARPGSASHQKQRLSISAWRGWWWPEAETRGESTTWAIGSASGDHSIVQSSSFGTPWFDCEPAAPSPTDG